MEKKMEMDEVTSLEGPVLKKNGELMLMIPLLEGGYELVECSRGISEIEGDFLKIVIPDWLAGVVRVEEGDLVNVNNCHGKFNISPVSSRPVH